jgi:hypothetical protein
MQKPIETFTKRFNKAILLKDIKARYLNLAFFLYKNIKEMEVKKCQLQQKIIIL